MRTKLTLTGETLSNIISFAAIVNKTWHVAISGPVQYVLKKGNKQPFVTSAEVVLTLYDGEVLGKEKQKTRADKYFFFYLKIL